MANFHFRLTKLFLQLAILYILILHSIAQKDEETDRVVKKRGEDAWFLENSAWPPMPYDYGYEIRDLEGNEQYRNEQSDGNRVTGSYGYFGSDGIYRHVDYVADALGFRAQIRTSEPGVAAQNPANVKIITEPLLPQPAPVPGGRILRPVETPGIFDSSIITDPVVQNGLTYIPNSGTSGGSRGRGSSTGSSTGSSDSGDDVSPPARRPVSTMNTAARPSSGGSLSGTGRPSYTRELAAGRDASIVTRDPRVFNGIDDILGIGGRGISIPIERPKSTIPVHNMPSTSSMDSGKAREDSSGSRMRGSSNSDIDELLRNRKLLERERELAAREQSLLERERNANRMRNSGSSSGIKGGGYRQISIPAHETTFKRRDSSSSLNRQQQSEMSDASTIDKEPADSSEMVKKNGSNDGTEASSNKGEDNSENISKSVNNSKEPIDSGVNALEAMLTNKNKGPVKVYLSVDSPTTLKDTAKTVMNGSGNKREKSETTIINTNSGTDSGMKENEETSTRKSFESTDQQISHLKFDDETDKIIKYRLKPQRNAYLQQYNNQFTYPIDYQNSNTNDGVAIQLKRSYPKNYQQFKLLRSRLPRERPSIRQANRKQLTSLSNKNSKVIKNEQQNTALDKNLIDGQHSNKNEIINKLRMGGDRVLNSIRLTNKIITLKDNEQSSSIKTDQRINFRSELLPKVNIAYNLIKKTGLLNNENNDKQTTNENNNEKLANQLYIKRYTNQTISTKNLSQNNNNLNLKNPNDALLLTNVNLNRNNLSNIYNLNLSSDASSIEEILFPPLNNSKILDLIKNLTMNSNEVDKLNKSDENLNIDNLNSNMNDKIENIKLDDENLSTITTPLTTVSNLIDTKSLIDSTNELDNSKTSSNNLKIFKPFSILSPLELQLIKLTHDH